MPEVLAAIYRQRARRLRAEMEQHPEAKLRSLAEASLEGRRPLREALLAGPPPAVIAEVKRASPSAGVISTKFDPAVIATRYLEAGAAAVSVLTEADHFGGQLADLAAVRAACPLPLLRKDFLTTTYELAQSAAFGADAVLAIVAGLSPSELERLLEGALEWRLEVLVEVHSAPELERALAAGATLIGINNRDLRTLITDTGTTRELLPLVRRGVLAVSESGYSDPAQLRAAWDLGVPAFLVGEALMRSPDPGAWMAAARGEAVSSGSTG